MLAPLLGLALVAAPPPSNCHTMPAPDAFAQGLAFFHDADFEKAIPCFQRSVSASPSSDKAGTAKGELYLGLAFLNTGDKDDAKYSFRGALLADPNAALPDDAPPAAIPMFANVKGDLARDQAQRAAQQRAEEQAAAQHQGNTKPRDVPAANKPPPADDHPELVEYNPPDNHSSGPLVPSWAAPTAGGISAGLGAAALTFKLLSDASFNSASSDATATQAMSDSHRADQQQHLARGLGLACAGTAVTALALYLLSD